MQHPGPRPKLSVAQQTLLDDLKSGKTEVKLYELGRAGFHWLRTDNHKRVNATADALIEKAVVIEIRLAPKAPSYLVNAYLKVKE